MRYLVLSRFSVSFMHNKKERKILIFYLNHRLAHLYEYECRWTVRRIIYCHGLLILCLYSVVLWIRPLVILNSFLNVNYYRSKIPKEPCNSALTVTAKYSKMNHRGMCLFVCFRTSTYSCTMHCTSSSEERQGLHV